MAIYAITGKPRHGKTYYLATLISEWLNSGVRVFSNVKINLGEGSLYDLNCVCLEPEKEHLESCIVGNIYSDKDLANDKKILFYWRNIHEWNHMKAGIIVADEGTRYFNPRKWAMLSEDTEIKLQQHGKEDLDIFLTVQHYSRLDVTLRLLVEKFFHVERVFGSLDYREKTYSWIPRGVIRITEQEFENINEPPKDAGSMIKFIWKKYFSIYDTRQAVGRSESMPLVHHTRECKHCGKVKVEHF